MRKAHKQERPTGASIEEIRVALVELRRLFQRRELTELWAAEAGAAPRLDYGELRLLDAIHVATSRTTHGATVGDVSRLLGVDPSRASRQVAAAVAAGLLRRRAAPGDGRKVVLAITARGASLQAKGSALTRSRIAVALRGWSAADRASFAQELGRFVAAIVA